MGMFDKKNDRKLFDIKGKSKQQSDEPAEERSDGGDYYASIDSKLNVPLNADEDADAKHADAPVKETDDKPAEGNAATTVAGERSTGIWPKYTLPKEYSIDYTDEGVRLYFKLDRAFADEQREAMTRHLARKEIVGIDTFAFMTALNEAECDRKIIAPPQSERIYDEVYSVTVSQNQLEAYISILPADPGGGKKLDPDTVIREIETKYGIRYGLDKQAVRNALERGLYDEPQLIAFGTAAVPGEDGRLEFNFDTREDGMMNRVRLVEDTDKVDYYNLDLFERVQKDQLLVSRIPPKDGIPGATVLGQILPAEPGKAFNLPVGRNTYITADKSELRAKESGSVEYINGTVRVSHCYIVDNVDMKTGNIDFDGDIIVQNNVLSGFSVKSTGSIEILGMAEAASITAEGDIFIRGGIQGAGKGILTAKGNIFIKFAENATIQANNMVVAESLLHSNVSSFGPVEVINGRGCIIGGNVCAGTYIAAQLVGNSSGRATNIEVGVSPKYRARLLELEEQFKALEADINKIQAVAMRPARPGETPKQKEYRMELMKTLLVQNKLRDDCVYEMEELKERMDEMKNGQVHVLKEAYPGVKINIGITQYSLERNFDYATFKLKDGEVEFTNCRFSPTPIRPKRVRR